MRKEDCYQLGHISRLHGYKGEVVAFFDTDQPQNYYELESVFVDVRGELVPFFIEEIATNSKGHFIIRFEDVTPEDAEAMVGYELFLPLSFLPPLDGKKFYFHEVVDFDMIDAELGNIGKCAEVIDSSSQPIFKILDGEKEILVPAVDNFIEAIDRQKKEIHLNCPPGLIDLYRSEE